MGTALSQDNGTLQDLSLTVTENYGTPAINVGTTTSTVTRTWKAGLSDEDFITKDFDTDYVTKKFLTNVPRGTNIQMTRGQDVYLEMIDDSGAVSSFFNFYDSDGILLETLSQNNTFGIWQLNMKDSILDALLTVSIADVAYFTVKIGLFCETLTYEYFDDYCNYPFSLMWMNEYGAKDSYVFKHNNELKASVKESSYRSQFGKWVGNSFVYSVTDSGQIDYVKQIKQSGTITTDYITEEFQNYLVEIFDSPFYLLYDINGYSIAIVVNASSYSFDQSRFDELLMLEVKYDKASSKRSLTL